MRGNIAVQQTKGMPTVLSLVAELRAQGWRIENGNQKWSAFPPDRSKNPVYFRNLENGREMRNVLGYLRKSGFIWHETDEERAELTLVEDGPVSAPASGGFIIPPEWSQPKDAPSSTPYPLNETFGQALKRIRLAAGSDRHTVAELVGVSDQAILNWEADDDNPVLQHYTTLLGIFPELSDAPQPSSRDINKPRGRTPGSSNVFTHITEPPVTETKLITMPEEPDTMNQPKLAIATHALIDKATLVRLVKLAVAAQNEDCSAMKQLLKEARDAHLTITDVLDILES